MSVSSLTARVAVRPLSVGLAVIVLSGGHSLWEAAASSVTVTVDGQRQTVRTHGSTVQDVLDAAGVKVGEHDLLAPSKDVELTGQTSVVVRRGRLMHLTVDGTAREVWVTALSVDEALGQIGIRAAGALLSADRSRAIPLKGFSLDVRTRKQVQVLDAGRVRRVASNTLTVGELLREKKIKVGSRDLLAPAATAPLKTGQVVRITRVAGGRVVDTVAIGFKTDRRPDSSMWKGDSRVLKQGRVGALRRTFAVTYVNGHLRTKKLLKAVKTADPVTEVVAYGTRTRPYSVEGADHLNWDALAQCESGGNPRAIGGGGKYRGLYQFMLSTWQNLGGQGDPIEHSSGEQTYRAKLLYKRSGRSPWPTCGKYL